MRPIKAIFNHIKNRTLLDRLVNREKHRLFKEYQDFLNSDRKYIEKAIGSSLNIRLFKKANLSQQLYCYGFEEKEMAFFKGYLRPSDTVLDIGANIGLFTLISAERVTNSGRVYSFEPSPQTYEWLDENIKANGLKNVKANKMALSDKNGNIDFYISVKGYDAFNSVIKPSKGEDYRIESVQTTNLNAFVEQENLQGKIAFIKIDVEGFEIPLLSGADKVLSAETAPDLLIEFTEGNAKNAGNTCMDLYDKVVSFGYELFQYDLKSNTLVPEPRGMNYSSYKNLVATKNRAKVNERLSAN